MVHMVTAGWTADTNFNTWNSAVMAVLSLTPELFAYVIA